MDAIDAAFQGYWIIGYITNTILHYYHGPKINRGYGWRNNILRGVNYDPLKDTVRNADGILNITNPFLETQLREYFLSRKEDEQE
jgi:hypothetical protein